TLKIDKDFFCTAENLKKKYFAEMFKAEELIKNIPEGETKTIKIKGEFNKYLYPFSRLADAIRQCKGYVDLDISETIKLWRIGYDYDCWDEKPIGNNGLKDCIALVRIVLPKKDFYYLDYGAFLNCSSLREVELSENIKELGGDTFKGCNALTEICIPKTVSCLYEAEIAHGNGGPFGFVFGSLNDSSIQKIYYAGSIVDWEKIKTVSKWKYPDDHYHNDWFHRNDVNYNRIEIVYDCPAWKLAEIKKEEAERLIAEKQAEKERQTAEEEKLKSVVKHSQMIEDYAAHPEKGVPVQYIVEVLKKVNRSTTIKIVGDFDTSYTDFYNAFLLCFYQISLDLSEAKTEKLWFSGCGNLISIILPSDINEVPDGAFEDCESLKTVNYCGSKKQWKSIKIGKDNKPLLNAKINYDYKAK
ncbi:MAG: leucine-rich repeat protein, partial [Treponema sp.]|nr:leucine-rich repeat protein [Treponema sp.]